MSEYNPIVINWAGRAKRAGLSFLIVNLGTLAKFTSALAGLS